MAKHKNHQPFYHRAVILFTAVRDVDHKEVLAAAQAGFDKNTDVIKASIEIEECDSEAGDPADLL